VCWSVARFTIRANSGTLLSHWWPGTQITFTVGPWWRRLRSRWMVRRTEPDFGRRTRTMNRDDPGRGRQHGEPLVLTARRRWRFGYAASLGCGHGPVVWATTPRSTGWRRTTTGDRCAGRVWSTIRATSRDDWSRCREPDHVHGGGRVAATQIGAWMVAHDEPDFGGDPDVDRDDPGRGRQHGDLWSWTARRRWRLVTPPSSARCGHGQWSWGNDDRGSTGVASKTVDRLVWCWSGRSTIGRPPGRWSNGAGNPITFTVVHGCGEHRSRWMDATTKPDFGGDPAVGRDEPGRGRQHG
jgi:hypothetical protein